MELVAFYGFALLAVLPALFMLFTKNLIYAAFALFITFLGVAALYVLAGADFLAVTQIMVYVGGILVLLIFGIMITQNSIKSNDASAPNTILVNSSRQLPGILLATVIFLFLVYVALAANYTIIGDIINSKSTVRTIGVELMTTHLLPFEIAGIILLVALVGATYLAMNRNPTHE